MIARSYAHYFRVGTLSLTYVFLLTQSSIALHYGFSPNRREKLTKPRRRRGELPESVAGRFVSRAQSWIF